MVDRFVRDNIEVIHHYGLSYPECRSWLKGLLGLKFQEHSEAFASVGLHLEERPGDIPSAVGTVVSSGSASETLINSGSESNSEHKPQGLSGYDQEPPNHPQPQQNQNDNLEQSNLGQFPQVLERFLEQGFEDQAPRIGEDSLVQSDLASLPSPGVSKQVKSGQKVNLLMLKVACAYIQRGNSRGRNRVSKTLGKLTRNMEGQGADEQSSLDTMKKGKSTLSLNEARSKGPKIHTDTVIAYEDEPPSDHSTLKGSPLVLESTSTEQANFRNKDTTTQKSPSPPTRVYGLRQLQSMRHGASSLTLGDLNFSREAPRGMF